MESLNDRIDRLVKKGTAFVVLSPFSKVPPKGITFDVTKFPSDAQIEEYRKYPDNSNIGIFCGEVNGFWVLDVDSADGVESIKKLDLPPTLTIKTPRKNGGYHLYFKWDARIERKIKILPGLDIIVNGYVLMPGSEVNKNNYRIVKNFPITAFPEEKFHLLFDEKVISLVVSPNGETLLSNETNKKDWWLDVLKGSMEGDRNANATRLAGYLFAKSLPKNMILSMLGHWDLQNEPPLGSRELRTIVDSVSRYHKDISENDLVSLDITFREPKVEFVEYIEPKVIVKGGMHVIVGNRGTGKTFFATQLVASLVGRDSFLGLGVKNCKVLFMQKEIPYDVFKSERLGVFMGIKNNHNVLFYKNAYDLKINQRFVDLVEKSECDIFVIDPLKLFWGISLEEQKKSIDILFELCNKRNKTGIIVHHYRKAGVGDNEKSKSLDNVAGLGDWTDLATTVINLTEMYDSQDFTVYMEFKKVRFCDKYDTRLLPKYLKFNKNTLTFEVTEVTVKNKIMTLVSNHPRGIKQSDLIDLCGGSPGIVSKTIAFLEREGTVGRIGKLIKLNGGD